MQIGAATPARIPTSIPVVADRYFKKNIIPSICRLMRENR